MVQRGTRHTAVTLCPKDQVKESSSWHKLLLNLPVNGADVDTQRMALGIGDLGRGILSTVGKGRSLPASHTVPSYLEEFCFCLEKRPFF